MESSAAVRGDHKLRERLSYTTRMMNYTFYPPRTNGRFMLEVPWHWHDEFEFGMVVSGTVAYRTNQSEHTLSAGDGIFINAGVLHSLQPAAPNSEARIQTHFFDGSFLSGRANSLIDRRYIQPVQECRALDAMPLYAARPEHACLLERLHQATALVREKPLFFELRLERLFLELWEWIYRSVEGWNEEASPARLNEEERLKLLITYIHERYQEPFSVDAMAQSVHISQRECYRIFRRCLGTTPIAFLHTVRLEKAQALLRDTALSMTDIALSCGFSSSSYFGRLFQRQHHLTPRMYRRAMAADAKVELGHKRLPVQGGAEAVTEGLERESGL